MGGDRSRAAVQKDLAVLASFLGIYCGKKHPAAEKRAVRFAGPLREFPAPPELLCPDCGRLLLYGAVKRVACPYDKKPSCRFCPANCYRDDYREAMKKVMRFSGKYHLLARWRAIWRRWLP